MKNVAIVLGAFLTLFLVACEGDPGPPGFDGPQGPQGPPGEDGLQAQLFEVDGVNFNYLPEDNLYEAILVFDDFTGFQVGPNDAVLVYRYDRTVDFDDGTAEDIWSLVPLDFFLEQGTIQYLSGHTTRDVEILINGNFNLANLDTGFIDNQLFRVAILPGVAATAKMDKSNIAEVMNFLGLEEKDVQKIRMK
ncbi:MAG: collagen-like protein [Pricia sp.]